MDRGGRLQEPRPKYISGQAVLSEMEGPELQGDNMVVREEHQCALED